MKIEIKHRWNDAVLFTRDAENLGEAAKLAIASSANLSGANLSGANLSGANLSGANLSGANLISIRDDIWAVLSGAANEVEGLRLAIIEGKIDGTTYEKECSCLVGTLGKIHDPENSQFWKSLPLVKPNETRPAERFFYAINKGDKPETSQFSKLALQWVDEWLVNMKAAFGSK